MNEQLSRQYTSVYGPLRNGYHAIGTTVHTSTLTGVVVWSYDAARGFTYVVDTGDGFPTEVYALDIDEAKSIPPGRCEFQHVGDQYRIIDQAGHTATLTPEQAAALLEWLYQQRDELFKQMCGAQ